MRKEYRDILTDNMSLLDSWSPRFELRVGLQVYKYKLFTIGIQHEVQNLAFSRISLQYSWNQNRDSLSEPCNFKHQFLKVSYEKVFKTQV